MSGNENDLRDLFASAETPATPIDASTVIARSRRRRLPRQLAAGAVSVLAVAGLAVVTVQSLQVPTPAAMSTMEQPAADSGAETIKRAPADRLNLCTAPIAEIEPSRTGLQVDAVFPPSVPVGTDVVQGIVRLTNTGSETVTGTTGPTPAITVSQDGVTLWHTNGPVDSSTVMVDLAPGETLEFEASFVPVRCGVEDDAAEQFTADLPALPAGDYELSVAMDFWWNEAPADGSTPGLDLITGPRSAIILE